MLRWIMKRKIEKVMKKAQADVLTKENAKVDLLGNAMIPPQYPAYRPWRFRGKSAAAPCGASRFCENPV